MRELLLYLISYEWFWCGVVAMLLFLALFLERFQ